MVLSQLMVLTNLWGLFHHGYPFMFCSSTASHARAGQVVDPDTTLSCMKTVPVSLAAAEQRAGSRTQRWNEGWQQNYNDLTVLPNPGNHGEC